MSLIAQALWVEEPGRAALRDEQLTAPAPGEVLIETDFSALSRGTERLVFLGLVPPSERERMRAPFQGGELSLPVKYGYANVGRVIGGEPARLGERVFTLYPHQTRFVVPASAAVPLPHDVPSERAVLAANLETAINATWDSDLKLGDRVAVIGAGVVGCLVAYLARRHPGTRVTLLDIDVGKRAIAERLGVRFASPEHDSGPYDLVFHASGVGAGLLSALRLAADEATILELSWLGSQAVSLPLGADFHARRLTLKSSQVGRVAPSRRARYSHRDRLALALELLADPLLDALIDSEGSFASLPDDLRELATTPRAALCHRVRYPSQERR